jgi:hypothetical protein
MDDGIEPTLPSRAPVRAAEPSRSQRSAAELFREAAHGRPIRAALGLGVEYAMFASAVGLAAALFATRVPLGWVDRTFGLSLRERFVDLLARISPG